MVAGQDTNPKGDDGARLKFYWTYGAGSKKIQWGVPGDFDRCRAQLGKYVQGHELDGLCANMHHDALGYWPNEGPHAGKHGHS